MKKTQYALLTAAGMAVMLSACGNAKPAETAASAVAQETAAETPAETEKAEASEQVKTVDLDAYILENTTLSEDKKTRGFAPTLKHGNINPTTGYYDIKVSDGRTAKVYIGDHAAIRAYITVIAVPDGTEDTYAFLKKEGWIDLADQYGETIFALEPASGKWGTPEEEKDYLTACLGESISNTAYDTRETTPGGIVTSGKVSVSDGSQCPIFSGHACNYYVGYGEGVGVLESFTAEFPHYAVAQAFISGKTDDALQKAIETASKKTYNGINVSSYGQGIQDDAEWQQVLDSLKESGDIANSAMITNADIPVPTMFAGYDEKDSSIDYWKKVNDTEDTAENGVYWQKSEDDAWQTQFTNAEVAQAGWTHGISAVKVTEEQNPGAKEIRDFLAQYTRYTFQFAYSNALGLRTDYYETTRAAKIATDAGKTSEKTSFTSVSGEEKEVEVRALTSSQLVSPIDQATGTFYSLVDAFNDYNDDGVLDPRESIVYIPDSAKKEANADGVPAVIIWPGSTQACSTFMDCSQWWAIANDEGCAIAIMGQFPGKDACRLSYGDQNDSADFSRSEVAVLKDIIAKEAGIKLDTSRIYASGHSAGCRMAQTLTHTTETYYAGIAATSFANTDFGDDSNGMPTYLFAGQADLPFLVAEPWEPEPNVKEGFGEMSSLNNWLKNLIKYNGLDVTFTDGDKDSFLKSCADYSENGRFRTYTWNDAAGAPVIRFGRTIAREHNCIPDEFRLAWDYLKDFRQDENGIRYYSPSGFTKDGDAVEILKK
ncbi:MAG: hypothetical protein ACOYBK_05425 [Bilifractor sp.]|jgi:hypothetical protein